MAIKTQGTQLYFIDPDGDVITTVGCVTAISGIQATRSQIDTTCLENEADTSEAGTAQPGNATFGINFDTSDVSHVTIYDLYRAGTKLQWAIGFSDGSAAPSGASGGQFNLPTSRSWISFEGYISDLPFDFALRDVVKSTVSVQVSGFPELHPKA
jgi:hypothetical protein